MEKEIKKIQVYYHPILDGKSIEQIHNEYEKAFVPFYAIAENNWQLPYSPKVLFGIGRSNDYLYVHFMWTEEDACVEHFKDMEAVCEDSCVEFFCTHATEKRYFNFEFNRIGVCNASLRTNRTENVQRLNEQERQSILRAYTPKKKHTIIPESEDYKLTIGIPLTLLGIDEKTAFPLNLRGNFYKCAQRTHKHLLSWNPIDLPEPDFHCPDCFGEIIIN